MSAWEKARRLVEGPRFSQHNDAKPHGIKVDSQVWMKQALDYVSGKTKKPPEKPDLSPRSMEAVVHMVAMQLGGQSKADGNKRFTGWLMPLAQEIYGSEEYL